MWDGQRWYNTREALENAGAPSGKVWVLSAAGNGSKVYVSDGWKALRDDRGFLGELRDGKLRLAPAPATCHEWRRYRPWRDPQGGVWLLAGRVVKSQFMAQPYAACVDHQGTIAEINDAGWPRLIDRSGCLWLAGLRDGPVPQEAIHICKQGKIVQELQVPGRVEGDTMVSRLPRIGLYADGRRPVTLCCRRARLRPLRAARRLSRARPPRECLVAGSPVRRDTLRRSPRPTFHAGTTST